MTAQVADIVERVPRVEARARWPRVVGYAAAAWSLLYGALGLYWALGGAGFPFGAAHDAGYRESLLGGVQAQTAAPVVAGLGLIAALGALLMTWAQDRAAPRAGRLAALAFAWGLSIALLILIPDRRVLMALAYAPLFLVGAPFHWPHVSFLKAIPWPVLNQMILMAGGALWAAHTLAYQRLSGDACVSCGRRAESVVGWTSPAAAARWGRWAVVVAVVCPAIYAATRFAWALGIPLGISERFLREGQMTGLWWAGAGLSTVALGGAILTLGLVQRWGEVFPRWMIGLAGNRVPPALAIAPALLVAVALTSSGLEDTRVFLIYGLHDHVQSSVEMTWSTIGPTLLWPLWGAALAAATYAYYLRRRGACDQCGRG